MPPVSPSRASSVRADMPGDGAASENELSAAPSEAGDAWSHRDDVANPTAQCERWGVKGTAAPPSAPSAEVDVFPSAAAPSRHRAARAEGLAVGAEGLVSNGSAGAQIGVGVWDAACGLESRVPRGERPAAPIGLRGEAAAGDPAAAAAAARSAAACAATVFRPAHQLLTALSDRFRPPLAPFSSRLLPPPPLAAPSVAVVPASVVPEW